MRFGLIPGGSISLKLPPQQAANWTYDTEHTADVNTLVLYHSEDNAANTNVTDSSGNGYNGTAGHNTDTFTTATGQFNRGFDFVGASRNVTNATAALLTKLDSAMSGNITIEGYYKSSVADWSTWGNTYSSFWRLWGDSNNFMGVQWLKGTNQIAYPYKGTGTIKDPKFTPVVVDTTTYFHVAQTKSTAADEMKIFFNGVQDDVTQSGLNGWTNSAAYVTYGNESNAGAAIYWMGSADEFAISNKIRY